MICVPLPEGQYLIEHVNYVSINSVVIIKYVGKVEDDLKGHIVELSQ